MADIFREVDEELRQDQLKQIWKRYGRLIVAAMVAVVLAVGGFQAWKAWDLSQRTALSDRFADALGQADSGDTAAAEEALAAIAAETSGGYGTLAAFAQARLRAETGDTAGAAALWERVANEEAEGSPLQRIAVLLAIMHQVDDGDAAALETRLAPLTKAGEAFRPTALELTAILALRQGDRARARETYALIVDDLAAPAGLRARAAQMIEALAE